MKDDSKQRYLGRFAEAAVGIAFLLVSAVSLSKDFLSNALQYVTPGLIGMGIAFFAAYWVRLINRNPYPLKVALIGPPRCGKTVYLTVLFRELQLFERGSLRFEPYGIETIETVTRNLSTLTTGKWLTATSVDSVFFFRANAILGNGILRKRYTVEIGDYAGERLAEFDSSSEFWLHRTSYFDYAVGSDIVFLGIDAAELCDESALRSKATQLRLFAALQLLIEKKGVSPGRLLQVPVGLLILKSDLLDESGIKRDQALHLLNRLIVGCRARCRFFRCFFVSSIGPTHNPETPPPMLHPENVMDPMVWGMEQVKIGS